jgi:hypothetical protein
MLKNNAVQWLALLLYIEEVLASNFHPVPTIKTVPEVLLRLPGHMLGSMMNFYLNTLFYTLSY